MKLLFKILFLLILIIAISLTIAYSLYSPKIHEKIRLEITQFLSERTNLNFSMGSISIQSLSTISISHLEIFDSTGTTEIGTINSIEITPDMFSLIFKKTLRTTVHVDGFQNNKIFSNFTIRTESAPYLNYKNALDLDTIENLFVIEGNLSFEKIVINNIFGSLTINNFDITQGKLHLLTAETDFLINFTKNFDFPLSYKISAQSSNLGFSSNITKENNTLYFKNLEGIFNTVYFDFDGEIENFEAIDKNYTLNGQISIDLKSLSSTKNKIGEFLKNNFISGKMSAHTYITGKNLSINSLNVDSTIVCENLKINKFLINEITSKLLFNNGRLDMPNINAFLYHGYSKGNLKMDLVDGNYPYILSLLINNINFEKLVNSLSQKPTSMYGKLNGELYLDGYALSLNTLAGNAKIDVNNANLGEMPLLTPILGDAYSAFQTIFDTGKKLTIDRAFADLKIKDKKISTKNLTFLGEEIYITSYGNLDFTGKLDFTFCNQFSNKAFENEDEWPIAIRNAIVDFGKKVTLTKLGGTISSPEWYVEYLNPFDN